MHVVHCQRERYTVRIDRPGPFGNPHRIGWCRTCQTEHTRHEAIEAFERDARASFRLLGLIAKLPEDAILGCWCKPQACHGDAIVRIYYEMWHQLHADTL